ncbi:FAD-binding domain-containing protein [Byssothecium circinans]|uniref:FAD-binding domain-containing protein n=1 Tax=Byssothecium circinans TaxID=147558 RepID=A0A6A5TFD3_9PLEO|nr:FAD-binding domain-containing protein [Byssothecium circinans]
MDAQLQQALSDALPDAVFTPGSDAYAESVYSYFSSLAQLKPALVITPQNAADVSTIIKILKPFVDGRGVKIAIKSGGATPTPGAANIDGGITIDLKHLTGIKLSADRKLVTLGVGETWGSVYAALESFALVVAGGRSSRSSVGGQITNGGLSWLSPQVGFSCDQVTSFEVVLADGSIVTASASDHADLWLALRGGSNNFGIVTRVTMATLPHARIWGGSSIYMEVDWPAQLREFATFLDEIDDPHGYLLLSIGYMGAMGRIMCKNSVYYTKLAGGCEEANPPLPIVPFSTGIPTRITPMSRLGVGSIKEFADIEAAAKDGARVVYMTTTFGLDLPLLNSVSEAFKATIETLKAVPGLVYSLSFQGFSMSLLSESASKGGNSLGLSPEGGPLVLMLLFSSWEASADDDLVISTQQSLIGDVDALARNKGRYFAYRFLPYAHVGQDVFTGCGDEVGTKLKSASRKYDPDGFFQKGVPGGFKLTD